MVAPLQIRMVSGDGLEWEGDAVNVNVRTPLGELGILSGHAPILTPLEPGAVIIVTLDGKREVFAVDGGFLSVFENKVSILSGTTDRVAEYSLEQARSELAQMRSMIDSGRASDEEVTYYNRLVGQVRAGEKYRALQ